jgi:hypothetical protein
MNAIIENTAPSVEQRYVAEIASEYLAKGYRVLIEPKPEALPDFLRGFTPDLMARSDTEVRRRSVLRDDDALSELAGIVEQHPQWRLELIVIGKEQAQ